MGLLSGWVCEQGRTQMLIVLKDIPKPHLVNKKVTLVCRTAEISIPPKPVTELKRPPYQ